MIPPKHSLSKCVLCVRPVPVPRLRLEPDLVPSHGTHESPRALASHLTPAFGNTDKLASFRISRDESFLNWTQVPLAFFRDQNFVALLIPVVFCEGDPFLCQGYIRSSFCDHISVAVLLWSFLAAWYFFSMALLGLAFEVFGALGALRLVGIQLDALSWSALNASSLLRLDIWRVSLGLHGPGYVVH